MTTTYHTITKCAGCSVNTCTVQTSLTLASAVFANCFAFSNLHALVKIERSRVRAGCAELDISGLNFHIIETSYSLDAKITNAGTHSCSTSVVALSLLLLFQFLIAVFGILHLAKRRDVWQRYPLVGGSNKCWKGIRIGFANIGPWIPYVAVCRGPFEPPSIWLNPFCQSVRQVDISFAKIS